MNKFEFFKTFKELIKFKINFNTSNLESSKIKFFVVINLSL